MKKKPKLRKRLRDCRTKAEIVAFMRHDLAMWRRDFNVRFYNSEMDRLILERRLKGVLNDLARIEAAGSVAYILRDKLSVMRWHYNDALRLLNKHGIAVDHDIPQEVLGDPVNRTRRTLKHLKEIRTMH